VGSRLSDNVGAGCGVEFIGRKLDGLYTDSTHPHDTDIRVRIANILKRF